MSEAATEMRTSYFLSVSNVFISLMRAILVVPFKPNCCLFFPEVESRIDQAYLPKVLRNQCPDGLKIRASHNEVKVLVLYTGN